MRILTIALLAAAIGLGAPSFAEEGPGPDADTANSTLETLSLGEYWFGAEISKEDLEGKVVLFELWGS